MIQQNLKSGRLLSAFGLALIAFTGLLEYIGPTGLFVNWGYVTGILLTLTNSSRRHTVAAVMLSLTFWVYFFLNSSGSEYSNLALQNRLYALVGILAVGFVVVMAVRKNAEAARQISLMEDVFNHGTEGMALINSEGKVMLVNPFLTHMFGYEPGELQLQNIRNILPRFRSGAHGGNRHPVATTTRLIGRRKDGSFFPIEVSYNIFPSNQTVLTGIFVKDITERKRNEGLLKMKTSQLEEVNRELEAFTYSVSHDLRAPLRAITGYAEILNEDHIGSLNDDGQRKLRNIQVNAMKMGKLIDDLLGFSRLGRKAIRKSTVNMNELAAQVVRQLGEQQTVLASISIRPLHYAWADSSLIAQVMTNLLSNAIKYSSRQANARVEVNSEVTDRDVIFKVSDNGAGFNMKYADKLFGVFQRLHAATDFEGTGVGLAIVKRIVVLHGGKVWAEGVEGQGASFYFSLPRMKKQEEPSRSNPQ